MRSRLEKFLFKNDEKDNMGVELLDINWKTFEKTQEKLYAINDKTAAEDKRAKVLDP